MKTRAIAVAVLLAAGAGAWYWFAQLKPADPSPAAAEADERVREEHEAREAVRNHPADAQARLRLARALRRLGRPQGAEAELVRAIQLGLPEAAGQREAALQLAPQDWPPPVEGLIQRVVRENPDDREVLLVVADSYSAKGRWLNAEPLYTRLIALDPDKPELHYKRGVARMNAAHYGRAVDDFRFVLARDAANYQARLYLGNSLLGDARMTEAEVELRACRDQRPEAIEPLVGLATCAVERNDLGAAEELLKRAAERNANAPLVLQELASLYLRQQRTDPAIATLKRLIEIDPRHRSGHLQLAQALLAVGHAEEAKKHEEIYKELDRQEEARLAERRGMR
jgi:tetratricopeptide (TPR) repeat protein